ncbi:MAG: GNAT family N-acetyltransferase [Polynucleobacter sp.]
MIVYLDNAKITAVQAIDLYNRSILGERRPVDNINTFTDMLTHANLIITAWDENVLVGIARSLTDFSYVAYLADLAVDEKYQRQGIGKQLIEETKIRLGPECMIVLLAAPKANQYYEHLGFENHPRAWTLKQ